MAILHYTTLHYAALHYATLHCSALHYTALQHFKVCGVIILLLQAVRMLCVRACVRLYVCAGDTRKSRVDAAGESPTAECVCVRA